MIGNEYWVYGPLVFGPRSLAARFARDFEKTKQVFDALEKEQSKKLVGPRLAKVLGVEVLLLPSGTPTGWLPMANGGVFVRPIRKLEGKRPAASFVVPEKLPRSLEVGADWVLFDAVAGATAEYPKYFDKRAKDLLPVPLAPGRYLVEHSTPLPYAQLEYAAVRLRLEGTDAPAAVEVKRPAPFAIDAATKKQAKALHFIETEGGPLLALPAKALATWKGIGDGKMDGKSDYERACVNRGFILGKNEGLVLQEPESTALVTTKEGVVFVRWVGADKAVDLLAALPHAKKWKREKKALEVAGPLVLFDATLEGKKLGKRQRLDVPLKKGRYDIEWTEVDGVVEGGREVMAGFVRLTRR